MRVLGALKLSALVLVVGMLFGMGLNIGQHLVPAPASQVFLCVPGETSEACVRLDDEDTSSDDDEQAAPSLSQV